MLCVCVQVWTHVYGVQKTSIGVTHQIKFTFYDIKINTSLIKTNILFYHQKQDASKVCVCVLRKERCLRARTLKHFQLRHTKLWFFNIFKYTHDKLSLGKPPPLQIPRRSAQQVHIPMTDQVWKISGKLVFCLVPWMLWSTKKQYR